MFFLKVIEAFEKHNIPYAVAGHYAAAFHGCVQKVQTPEFIVENNLETFLEVQFAMSELDLEPQKFSAKSIYNLRDIEKFWIFHNPNTKNEQIIIHTSLSTSQCRSEDKSIFSYKVPVMSLYDLQKKLNFQIQNRNLINQKTFQLKAQDILQILEDYRTLDDSAGPKQKDKSILISIKIPQSLLENFKKECASEAIKYQTQIKNLMREWLDEL